MSVFGIDYAWSRPPISAMKSAGVKFVCRYLSYDTTGKDITKAELERLEEAGIWAVVVWETTASRALKGRAAGASDAKEAAKRAKALGQPTTRPIYFAVDFDARSGDWPKVAEYFRGVVSVIGVGRTGMYGGYDPIRWGFRDGLISWGWQTYAWSEGEWDDRAHLQQYANGVRLSGHTVDYNRAVKVDFGQWLPGRSPVTETIPDIPAQPPKWPGRVLTQPPMMKGDDVKRWQKRMGVLGYPLVADGWYGAKSESACRDLQKRRRLAVDGKVGPKTWVATFEPTKENPS